MLLAFAGLDPMLGAGSGFAQGDAVVGGVVGCAGGVCGDSCGRVGSRGEPWLLTVGRLQGDRGPG